MRKKRQRFIKRKKKQGGKTNSKTHVPGGPAPKKQTIKPSEMDETITSGDHRGRPKGLCTRNLGESSRSAKGKETMISQKMQGLNYKENAQELALAKTVLGGDLPYTCQTLTSKMKVFRLVKALPRGGEHVYRQRPSRGRKARTGVCYQPYCRSKGGVDKKKQLRKALNKNPRRKREHTTLTQERGGLRGQCFGH